MVLSALSIEVNSWNSIRREERIPLNSTVNHSSFDTSEIVEMIDPRNGVKIGNYFQPRDIFEIEDVIIEPNQGLVYAKNSRVELLKESTRWPVHWSIFSYPVMPRKRSFNRRTIQKGILVPSNSFYHWLVEDLPATITTMEFFPQDVPLIVTKKPPQYVEDFLKTTTRRVVRASNFTNVKKLYMVDKGNSFGWPSPTDLKILNNYTAFKSAKKQMKRDSYVYISRLNSTRSPSNEVEIELLFKKHGFTICNLESLNLLQQMSIISSARIIAGLHGAGLSHLIWMQKKSIVFDIVNENFWSECYFKAAYISDVSYKSHVYNGVFSNEINLHELNQKILEVVS